MFPTPTLSRTHVADLSGLGIGYFDTVTPDPGIRACAVLAQHILIAEAADLFAEFIRGDGRQLVDYQSGFRLEAISRRRFDGQAKQWRFGFVRCERADCDRRRGVAAIILNDYGGLRLAGTVQISPHFMPGRGPRLHR